MRTPAPVMKRFTKTAVSMIKDAKDVQTILHYFSKNTSVHRHYNHAVVVFDGYKSGPSTKDLTHQRCANSQNIGAEVNFKPEVQLTMKKKNYSQTLRRNKNVCTLLAVSCR